VSDVQDQDMTKVVALIVAAIGLVGLGFGPAPADTFTHGGEIGTSSGNGTIVVPQGWMVRSLSSDEFGRIIVCAETESDSTSFRSEAWQFRVRGESGENIGFDDRTVLASVVSRRDKRFQRYAYSVVCEGATAVYIEGWESGRTAVFSATGDPVEIDWRTRKVGGTQTGFSIVRPVTWIPEQSSPIDAVEYQLICWAGFPGSADSAVLVFGLTSGSVEEYSIEAALNEFGPDLFHYVAWWR
jgi:hypothetical protein